jgi:hypothetical protein
MAEGDTLVCAMCGAGIDGADGALQAEGSWFCSPEHRTVFDAGRSEPGRRAFRRARIHAALILLGLVVAVVVYQAVWGHKPQPAQTPVEHSAVAALR